MKRGRKEQNPMTRFFSHVLVTDSCWLWQAALSPKGYGESWYKGKKVRANRFSYLLFRGDIPEGLHVCHTCDNPSCVNPDHLFLGTNEDNINDKVKKGRQSQGFGQKGKGNKYEAVRDHQHELSE